MAVTLQWTEDFAALLQNCEDAGKGHLRGILHRWHAAAVKAHLFGPPILTALVIYGEARGENPPGPQAVFEVIANRALRTTPHDLDAVLLRPYQFSCLNRDDVSLHGAEGESLGAIVVWLKRLNTFVAQFQSGARLRHLDKATMYATPRVCGHMYERWLTGDREAWAFSHMQFCRTIGNHAFFREV